MKNTRLALGFGRWGRAAGIVVACLTAVPAAASEAVVPSDLQAAIFARVLAYDRALKSRAGKTVTIGVLFQPSDDASKRMRQVMLKSFGALEPSVQGLPVRLVAHPYTDAKHLTEWVDEADVDVLYVTVGLSRRMGEINALAAAKKLVTLAPIREYVEQGLAIGVVAEGDHPQLVVNLPAARAAGMDLDPRALQLSQLIK
jgi:hypothetical protein